MRFRPSRRRAGMRPGSAASRRPHQCARSWRACRRYLCQAGLASSRSACRPLRCGRAACRTWGYKPDAQNMQFTRYSGIPAWNPIKAAQRFRDGDLSGAISAACGAVDTVTSSVYRAAGLGDPGKASFQERCTRSLEARKVISEAEKQLRALGWDDADGRLFGQKMKGAMNQGAYVMQTLRSKMGDVHGTKPILKPLVFDALKWAEILLR